MAAPVLASDPPESSPAIVQLPVFVRVTNWQGEIVDSQCEAGICVTMTATPSLFFDPGEPGAPSIVCVPPGSQFDPAGASAAEQAAAPGACAWAYRMRTGAEGRLDRWPGKVAVTWAVGWTASDGSNGSFPELSFEADAPRLVNEVQTVIVDDT
jgi:hypothetical protein